MSRHSIARRSAAFRDGFANSSQRASNRRTAGSSSANAVENDVASNHEASAGQTMDFNDYEEDPAVEFVERAEESAQSRSAELNGAPASKKARASKSGSSRKRPHGSSNRRKSVRLSATRRIEQTVPDEDVEEQEPENCNRPEDLDEQDLDAEALTRVVAKKIDAALNSFDILKVSLTILDRIQTYRPPENDNQQLFEGSDHTVGECTCSMRAAC